MKQDKNIISKKVISTVETTNYKTGVKTVEVKEQKAGGEVNHLKAETNSDLEKALQEFNKIFEIISNDNINEVKKSFSDLTLLMEAGGLNDKMALFNKSFEKVIKLIEKGTEPKDISTFRQSLQIVNNFNYNKKFEEITSGYSERVKRPKLSNAQKMLINTLAIFLDENSSEIKIEPQRAKKELKKGGKIKTEIRPNETTPLKVTDNFDVNGAELKIDAPIIRTNLYNLAKKHNGDRAIGGKDVERIRKDLSSLESTLFTYIREYSDGDITVNKNGKRTKQNYILTENFPILKTRAITTIEAIENGETKEITTEIEIILHPVFSIINNSFTTLPKTINKLLKDANDNKQPAYELLEAFQYLNTILTRNSGRAKKTGGIFTHKETANNFINKIVSDRTKGRGIKFSKSATEKALDVLKKLGLIKKWKQSGEFYLIDLVQNWQKEKEK